MVAITGCQAVAQMMLTPTATLVPISPTKIPILIKPPFRSVPPPVFYSDATDKGACEDYFLCLWHNTLALPPHCDTKPRHSILYPSAVLHKKGGTYTHEESWKIKNYDPDSCYNFYIGFFHVAWRKLWKKSSS